MQRNGRSSNWPDLTPRQRSDTRVASHISAIRSARIDVGHDWVRAGTGGVKIGIDDTAIASELQFASWAFGDIKPRLAKVSHQLSGGSAHHLSTTTGIVGRSTRKSAATMEIGRWQLPRSDQCPAGRARRGCATTGGQRQH